MLKIDTPSIAVIDESLRIGMAIVANKDDDTENIVVIAAKGTEQRKADMQLTAVVDIIWNGLDPKNLETPDSLKLATNDELIQELISRTTFRGTVCWQRANFKEGQPDDTDWSWRAANCNAEKVFRAMFNYLRSERNRPKR